ncbi:OSMR protein, partial [Centropus bengalensis]|nr:OSMR protein [Centropus bengalensis]
EQPDTPNDFSCQTQDIRTITCTWSQGGNTYLYGRHSPKYTLFEEISQKPIPCTVRCSKQCSCSWDGDKQRVWNITLTVENPLGKKTAIDTFHVTHRGRIFSFLFFHNISDTHHQYHRITLSGLQPHTEYTARARCGAAKHFWRWSEWSKAQTIRTKEAPPSGKLDIWREITPVPGGRNVTLYWKQASGFRANGRSISYEVTWKKEDDDDKAESITFPSVYNSTRISIDNHSYTISIKAKNDVNYSLPSVLIIPKATGNSRNIFTELSGSELKEERVNGTDDGIFISWERSDQYDSYIIDWCNLPMLQPCDLQWKRFGANTSSALISSGAFVPGVRYNFHIYGLAANRTSLLEKKTGYFRELPPLLDPIVEKIELTFNAVTLSWDSYLTNESWTGFVRGYRVYVSPIEQNCSLEGSYKHVLS